MSILCGYHGYEEIPHSVISVISDFQDFDEPLDYAEDLGGAS